MNGNLNEDDQLKTSDSDVNRNVKPKNSVKSRTENRNTFKSVQSKYDQHGSYNNIYNRKQSLQSIKIKSHNVSPRWSGAKPIGFKQEFVQFKGESFRLPTIDGWNQNDELSRQDYKKNSTSTLNTIKSLQILKPNGSKEELNSQDYDSGSNGNPLNMSQNS